MAASKEAELSLIAHGCTCTHKDGHRNDHSCLNCVIVVACLRRALVHVDRIRGGAYVFEYLGVRFRWRFGPRSGLWGVMGVLYAVI